MRHRVAGKHLKRDYDQRRALRRSLLKALFTHERIKTTEAKADFIRSEAEKLVTIAKRGLAHPDPLRAVHARRLVGSHIDNDRQLVGKIFDKIAPRYENRAGGYTRVYKLGPRKGDNAPMVLLEFVDRETE
ncbi:MAG TPA: 50S ribosomal protein L17 [Oceanobacillus sp.]|nr:50S ribosomal protein L17 [Oceanobacillus sp.]